MEIHFYESAKVLPADKHVIYMWETIDNILDRVLNDSAAVDEIHTTQMCMLSTTWLVKGYRIFVHQSNGVTYEIALKNRDHKGHRAVRVSQNIYGMWASGVFRE